MNKTYLGILFTIILLISVSSGLAAVNAGSWTSNSQQSININVGESAEFSYGVTAVTSYGGKYSIELYAQGNPTPIHTYVSLTPTVGNGALGTFTVTPTHYNSAAGSYYVLIFSSDKFSNATLKLYLTTTAIIIPPNPLVVSCSATPSIGYAPLTSVFSSSVSGGSGTYTYLWNFGDTATSASSTGVSHLYNTPNTYATSLTITDSNNQKVTADCGAVIVNKVIPNPLTTKCFSAPKSGTAPLDVAFDSETSGGTGPYSYEWNFGNNQKITNNYKNILAYTYYNAGTYNASLTITDADNNKATASCGTINVNPVIPALTASCSATPLIGNAPLTTTFISTVSGGSGTYTYLWNFGDTATSTSSTGVSHTYNTPNTYATSLTITDSNGNKTTTNCGTVNVTTPITPVTVSCTATPTSGYIPLDVTFSAVVNNGTAPNNYQFIFDDGQNSTVTSASNTGTTTHTYNIGSFVPRVIVTDSNNNVATANCGVNGITVTAPILNVDSITCFQRIVDGHNQSCSVFVSSNNGQVAGNVDIKIYYLNGTLFGTCKTDRLSGGCEVKNIVNGVNQYTVYATATGTGYVSDNNTYPRYTFDVFAQRYNVINLGTYNDSNFMYPDNTFYRGESLYVKFQVYDPDSNSFVTSDIVTAASLISLPGGRVDLSRMTYNGNWYYYELTAIPLTHDFLGDSNVFAFAFNFTGLTGGQAQVNLNILNNKPTISNIADVYINVGQSHALFLNNYGKDLEDHTLIWTKTIGNVTTDPVLFSANITTGNVLSITGLIPGTESITLRGYDLDDDYADVKINVHVLPGVITNNLTASCTLNPTSGDAPLEVLFTGTAANGSGQYHYEFDFGDGMQNLQLSNQTQYVYDTPGVYNATLRVIDMNTLKTITVDCGQVTVNTPTVPSLTVSCSATPTAGDAPLTSTFSSTVSGGSGTYTYLWTFGEGSTNTNPSTTTHTYGTAGTYNSTLTITDSANNVVTEDCGQITVNAVVNVLDVTCFTLPNVGIAPLDVSVIAVVDNGAGPYDFAFDFDNGNSANVATNSIISTEYTTYTLPGTYYPSITVTDVNGDIGSATCGFIIVNADNTNITFPIANAGGPYNGYVNEPVTFDASASVGSILNYRWDFGDGTGTFDTTSPTINHTYAQINRYDVKLVVFDSNGYVVDTKTTATIVERTTQKSVVVRDLPDKGIVVNSIMLYGTNGDVLSSNDELTAQIKLKNNWDKRLDNVRIVMSIPELGLETRSSLFDFSRGSEHSEALTLPLYDVPKGVYYVKIFVDNDEGIEQVKRTKYREIIVK